MSSKGKVPMPNRVTFRPVRLLYPRKGLPVTRTGHPEATRGPHGFASHVSTPLYGFAQWKKINGKSKENP